MLEANLCAQVTCALLLTLSAGCGSALDGASDNDVGSTPTGVEAGQARPLGLPGPCLTCCLTCPRTLASGSTPTALVVSGLAVTSSAVFFTGGFDAGTGVRYGIFQVPLSGGSPALFYNSMSERTNSIVAAGGALYWRDPGGSSPGIWTISPAGGTATELRSIPNVSLEQTQGIAVDVTYGSLPPLRLQFNTVVTGDPDNSSLWKFTNSTLRPARTTTTLLDMNALDFSGPLPKLYYPDSVTLDGSNAYFVSYRDGTGPNAVYQMSLSGGTPPITIGNADEGSPIAVYGGNVYFARGNTVQMVPVGGGSQSVFASDNGPPTTFAVDGSTLYWTCTARGTVSKQSFSGGTSSLIASNEVTPKFLAVDSSYVYWGTTGAIRTHAK
jgi:hypothetical protein